MVLVESGLLLCNRILHQLGLDLSHCSELKHILGLSFTERGNNGQQLEHRLTLGQVCGTLVDKRYQAEHYKENTEIKQTFRELIQALTERFFKALW